MPSWIALLPASPPEHGQLDALHLGWWALQFTPRVALLEEAVVLEVQASERLFGGAARLRQKVSAAALDLGARASAQAGTAHAALALARVGASGHGEVASLSELLAPLPLHSLSAVGRHAETLHRLGCRNLAQVRALPRGGLSRRFGAELLRALDAAHGTHPEAFDWLVLPPVFERRMELPWRLDSAEALHQAFERLLHELVAWLAGHQAGTQALQLAWCHDWARHSASRWCGHRVPLAEPTAEVSRLSRMVGEHLRRIELSSPVTDIRLRVDAIVPRESESRSLFNELPTRAEGFASDAMTAAGLRAQRSALLSLLERLSIRLGPDRVMAGQLQADHRLAHSQVWHAAIPGLAQGGTPVSASLGQVDGRFLSHVPQPTWVLPVPLRLALSGACAMSGWREAPLYQGPVRLLAGPHRIEAGWWDARLGTGHEARDHHLASSPHAGLLWVFRERHAPQDGSSPWRLLGFFA